MASASWRDGAKVIARVGVWNVGSVFWDSLRSKGSAKMHKAVVLLPGLNENLGHFETQKEAGDHLEKVVMDWFDVAGAA